LGSGKADLERVYVRPETKEVLLSIGRMHDSMNTVIEYLINRPLSPDCYGFLTGKMDEVITLHRRGRYADVETCFQSVVEYLNLNRTKVTR
jgi:hypothetical protein